MYAGRLWTMRQYAGFGTAQETNAPVPAAPRRGADGSLDRVRPADPDGLRLRPPDGAGRGGPGRGRDRHRRRPGRPLPGDPARPGLDLDDDQRHRGDPAGHVRRGRARSRASRAPRSPARCRTTCSRSTSRAGPTSIRPAPSLRLVADIFRFVRDEGMSFNPISISGYHMREAGATAVQEVGVHPRQRARVRAASR